MLSDRTSLVRYAMIAAALVAPSLLSGQNDGEIRELVRQVHAEGHGADVQDAVEQLRQIQDEYNAQADAIRTEMMTEQSPSRLWELRDELDDVADEFETRTQQVLDDMPTENSRRLAVRLRRAGIASLAILAFFSGEALGALDVYANPNSRVSQLYRRALRGDCAWVYNRVNDPGWHTQVELEFLAASVRTANPLTTAYFNQLREACRPRPAAATPPAATDPTPAFTRPTGPLNFNDFPADGRLSLRVLANPRRRVFGGDTVELEAEVVGLERGYWLPVRGAPVSVEWGVLGSAPTTVQARTDDQGRLTRRFVTGRRPGVRVGAISVRQRRSVFSVDVYDYVVIDRLAGSEAYVGRSDDKDIVRIRLAIRRRFKDRDGTIRLEQPDGYERDFSHLGLAGGFMKLSTTRTDFSDEILYLRPRDERGRFSIYATSPFANPYELRAWFRGGKYGTRSSDDTTVTTVTWQRHPVHYRLEWGESMNRLVAPDGTVRFSDLVEESLEDLQLQVVARSSGKLGRQEGTPIHDAAVEFRAEPEGGVRIIGSNAWTSEDGQALSRFYYPRGGETRIVISAEGAENDLVAIVNAAPSESAVIDSPRGGDVRDRVATIRGRITGRRFARALLYQNGEPQGIEVVDGAFSQTVGLVPGDNDFYVRTIDADGFEAAVSNRVRVFADIPRQDIRVVLRWDTPGTDVDLHIVEPNGEECYYGNKTTSSGGSLDTDDTDGFGPETYVLERAPDGIYTISVVYFASNGQGPTEGTVTLTWPNGRTETHRVVLRTDKERVVVARLNY